jgi:hypothetical protein
MGYRVKNRDQRSDASTPDAERRGHGDAASKDQSSEHKSSFVGAAFSRDFAISTIFLILESTH